MLQTIELSTDLTNKTEFDVRNWLECNFSRPHGTPLRVRLDPFAAGVLRQYVDEEQAQRKYRPSRGREFKDVIEAGEYACLTHEGIAFSDTGLNIDGQHRLAGLSMCGNGSEIEVWVFFGVPENYFDAIGTGAKRTQADALRRAGVCNPALSAATLRCMVFAPKFSEKAISSREIVRLAENDFAKPLDFAVGALSGAKKGVNCATVAGVLGRAWFTADMQQLRSFAAILKNGYDEGNRSDKTVLRLRDWLMLEADEVSRSCRPRKSRSGGASQRQDVYGRIQRVLRAFLDGEELTKIYPSSKDLFPIPPGTSRYQR